MNLSQPIKNHMTYFPTTVEGSTSLATVRKMMHRYDIRHLPVLEKGTLVGVLNEQEISTVLQVKGIDSESESCRAYARMPLVSVSEDIALVDVVQEMIRKKEEIALIFKDKKLTGVFTSFDVLKLAIGSK